MKVFRRLKAKRTRPHPHPRVTQISQAFLNAKGRKFLAPCVRGKGKSVQPEAGYLSFCPWSLAADPGT